MNKLLDKALILVIPICLLLTGCSETSKAKPGRIEQSDAFYEQVSIPELLFIDVDFNRMSTLTSVKQYTGETIVMDQETLVRAFLKDKTVEKSIWAAGVTYMAKDGDVSDHLNVFDGGESFGVPTDLIGGFDFTRTVGTDDPFKWGYVASQDFRSPNSLTPNLINQDFASKADLDFTPYAQAEKTIFEVLQAADLPDLVIDETCSLDLATMLAHLHLAQKGGPNWDGMSDEILAIEDWTAEDECYLFSLQQKVGELPVDNKGWSNPNAAASILFTNTMPITSVTLTYDHNGIRSILAQNLLRIVSEGEPVDLISGYDALKVLVDDYTKIIIERDIHIISAQLCYLLYPASEDSVSFMLKPGWIFTSFATDGSYSSFRFDMVDAVTGDLYPGRF